MNTFMLISISAKLNSFICLFWDMHNCAYGMVEVILSSKQYNITENWFFVIV
jgi:hypothetical protein